MTRKHYIYCYRSGCGRRRQPTHVSSLDALELAVRNKFGGKGHPYGLKYPEKQELLGALLEGLAGARRAAELPDSDYLYRICNVEDFIYNTQYPLSLSDLNEPDLSTKVWGILHTESNGQWRPVPGGSGKQYAGCGKISWWTDLPLPLDIVTSGLKIGMCTNWLIDRSILMRCKVSHIRASRLAYVPTILDAFCQMIFHPRHESKNPSSGTAIDLSRPGPLSTGASEFILYPIDCGQLEFLPISIPSDMKKDYKEHHDNHQKLLGKLLDYYADISAS